MFAENGNASNDFQIAGMQRNPLLCAYAWKRREPLQAHRKGKKTQSARSKIAETFTQCNLLEPNSFNQQNKKLKNLPKLNRINSGCPFRITPHQYPFNTHFLIYKLLNLIRLWPLCCMCALWSRAESEQTGGAIDECVSVNVDHWWEDVNVMS